MYLDLKKNNLKTYWMIFPIISVHVYVFDSCNIVYRSSYRTINFINHNSFDYFNVIVNRTVRRLLER